MRRIVAKCLCAHVKEETQSYFPPLQVGVACPLGIDAAIHVSRQWAIRNASDRSMGLVKLDFANAFNSVNRERILQRVSSEFPSLARWVQWCYAQESNLLFGDHTIGSAAGVQQGDPLGPLLFSLVVQPLAEELRAISCNNKKLDLTLFYLDDGVLAGDLECVAAALQLVEQRSAELGLELKVSKCELVLPNEATDADLQSFFPNSLLTDPVTGDSRVLTLRRCYWRLYFLRGPHDGTSPKIFSAT